MSTSRPSVSTSGPSDDCPLCGQIDHEPTGGQVCASVRLAFVYARVKVNWHIRLSHLEIFGFQDVIKKENLRNNFPIILKFSQYLFSSQGI